MNPSYYGKARSVSLEFRLKVLKTGEIITLKNGQVVDFFRKHSLAYKSAISRRSRNPHQEIPIYSLKRWYKPNVEVEFMMLPACLAQVRP